MRFNTWIIAGVHAQLPVDYFDIGNITEFDLVNFTDYAEPFGWMKIASTEYRPFLVLLYCTISHAYENPVRRMIL